MPPSQLCLLRTSSMMLSLQLLLGCPGVRVARISAIVSSVPNQRLASTDTQPSSCMCSAHAAHVAYFSTYPCSLPSLLLHFFPSASFFRSFFPPLSISRCPALLARLFSVAAAKPEECFFFMLCCLIKDAFFGLMTREPVCLRFVL